jgi:hypothetical protein
VFGGDPLVSPPAGGHPMGPSGHVAGDAVQPAGEHRRGSDRTRLPHEDQEDRLAGVVGVGLVPEDSTADAEDHRPMPSHQGGERGLVAGGGEPVEQLAVGRLRGRAGGPAEAREQVREWLGGHARSRRTLPM